MRAFMIDLVGGLTRKGCFKGTRYSCSSYDDCPYNGLADGLRYCIVCIGLDEDKNPTFRICDHLRHGLRQVWHKPLDEIDLE